MKEKNINKNEIEDFVELEDLSRDLTESLESLRIWKDGRVYIIKGIIDSINDLKICIYPNDHLPPHFHVVSKQKDLNARFNVYTLDFIDMKHGKISKDDIKKIKYHFLERRPQSLEKLRSEYERLNK